MTKALSKRIVSILFLSCLIVSSMLIAVDKPALASHPEDVLTGLIEQVEALVETGSLNHGNGNALTVKLSAAQRSLARGRLNAAVNQLEDFKDQVGDFVQTGNLSPDEGGPLIDEAAYIQAAVQCTDPLGCVTYRVGEPIRLGAALALSPEPLSILGVDSLRGVEIALDLQGDLFGHPLELIVADSMCSPEGGTSAANTFVADPQVAAIIGPNCSAAVRTFSPPLREPRRVMVSPSATSPTLSGDVDDFLRTAWNDRDQAVVMADLLYDLGNMTSAVIVTSDAFSQELGDAFVETFAAAGGNNLAYEVVSDSASITAALDVIASPRPPDVLFFPVFFPEAGEILTQGKSRLEFADIVFASADALFNDFFLEVVGEAAAEGLLVSAPNLDFSGNEIYADVFLPAYVAKYEESEIIFSPFAFDATNMILAGIEATATESDGVVQVGRQALREALFATENLAGATGQITCDPFGDCGATEIDVWTVLGGEFVPFPP